ncbi:MAG: hypothetical protein RR374_06600 [Clostridia bacterium]
MTKNKKIILKVLIFFTLIILLYTYSAMVLAPKSVNSQGGAYFYRGKGFYAEPTNSLDVFVCGNSDSMYGFSPIKLYNDYGITSFNSGVPKLTIDGAYSLIKQSLDVQKPKVVVLETDCVFDVNSKLLKILNPLYFFAIPIVYHSRWKDVKFNDFITMPSYKKNIDALKGYEFTSDISGAKIGDYMGSPNVANEPFKPSCLRSLNSITKLCNENDIKLVFLTIPSATSWTYAKHNALSEYAQKNGIEYIDGNVLIKELNFDWSHDSKDNGNHLNVYGANKVTAYLGNILTTKYGIIKPTDETLCKYWDGELIKYKQNIKIL